MKVYVKDLFCKCDHRKKQWLTYIKPFVPNATFLYPLKTSESLTVFWCFQWVEKGCIGNEWVIEILNGKLHFLYSAGSFFKFLPVFLCSFW